MEKIVNFLKTNRNYVLAVIVILMIALLLLFRFGRRHHRGEHGHHSQERMHSKFGKGNYGQAGELVHTVYFKLKPNADKAAMIKSLESLRSIKVVNKIEIGEFINTGNPTSLAGHTIIMQMTLDNLEAFRVYEKDSVHLASRDATKDLLAGPPIGYDFIKK